MSNLYIITATFNSEKKVCKALASINEQISVGLHHILIDGGSTDATVDIVRNKSDFLFALISEPDLGIYDALNKGVALVPEGEVFGVLHSDDYFSNKNICSSIMSIFKENPNIDLIYGNLMYVKENGNIFRRWHSGNFTLSKLSRGWMPPHPTIFIRKNSKTAISYNLSYKISSDYDYILKLFSNPNLNIFYLNKFITMMQIGGLSNRNLSNIIIKMREDYAIAKNSFKFPLITVALKNFRKINQLFYFLRPHT